MSKTIASEAAGDWRNFKGDYYHLLYVVWRLLNVSGEAIGFYQGNDLLAIPSPTSNATPALLNAGVRLGNKDIWIQLKSSQKSWSCNSLFKDVLFNFIHNALTSNSQGKEWEATLVTQGSIPQIELQLFIHSYVSGVRSKQINTNSLSKKTTSENFEAAISRALLTWNEENKNDPSQLRKYEHVQEIALEILKQLSEQEPLIQKVMDLEIRGKLLIGLRGSEEVARRIEDALIHDLIKCAAAGPKSARLFDEQWLTQRAGRPINPQGLFDRNPIAACNKANAAYIHGDWDKCYHVARLNLDDAINEFLDSKECVFTLVGMSGVGKSWTIAHLLNNICHDRLCLLVDGGALDNCKSIAPIIANQLRPFVEGDESDESLLELWIAAASIHDKTPILILDDLVPFHLDIALRQRQLKYLTAQAKQFGIKLIISGQWHIWRLSRICKEIPSGDVFIASDLAQDHFNASEEKTPFPPLQSASRKLAEDRISFLVQDFSADELEIAVRKRIKNAASEQVNSIAQQLRSPSFLPLRNPYVLSLYLEDYGSKLSQSKEAPALVIDDLLDEAITRTLDDIANQLDCSGDDLRPCLDLVVSKLWQAREKGLSHAEVARILEEGCGYNGSQLVRLFRRAGFLVPGTPVRFERNHIAYRLFALELEKRVHADQDILNEVNVEMDGDCGAVMAYIRHLSNITLPNLGLSDEVLSTTRPAVELAEQLLVKTPKWSRTICEGLAQASPNDIQVIAFLTAFARSSNHSSIRPEACRALAHLAARGGEAKHWAAEMYNSNVYEERLRGAIVLEELLEYDPKFVGHLVSLRLGKAAQFDWNNSKEKELRGRLLHWALHPLICPRHAHAAKICNRIIQSYSNLTNHFGTKKTSDSYGSLTRLEMPYGEIDWDLAEDFAQVRGGQIPWNLTEKERIINELQSSDVATRILAAESLRVVALERIEIVADILLDRLRDEENPAALSRLLWASHKLSRPKYRSRFLTSIREGKIGQWDDMRHCGPALVMLAEAAKHDPTAVLEIAPSTLRKLKSIGPDYLHEALVYLWWSLDSASEKLPAARRDEPSRRLNDLAYLGDVFANLGVSVKKAEVECAETNEDDSEEVYVVVERDGWPFLAHGAALAQLAIMGRGQFSIDDCLMHEMGSELPYYLSDMEEIVATHHQFLAAHPEADKLVEILLHCVRAQIFAPSLSGVIFDSTQKSISNSAFHIAQSSLYCLAQILQHYDDPIPYILKVPRTVLGDWQQLHLVSSLLEAGRIDASIIQLANSICSQLEKTHTANGSDERNRCLAVLASINGRDDTEEAVKEALNIHREHTKSGYFGIIDRTSGFVSLTDSHPERLLQLLDESIKNGADLLTLYKWEQETESWRSLLFARVFKRMFSARPINCKEAIRLCEWILAGLAALPESTLREQWYTCYSAIYSSLKTNSWPSAEIHGRKTPLQFSHLQAIWLFNEACSHSVLDKSWYDARLEPSHTIFNAETFSIKNGEVVYHPLGGGKNPFCFPAVRLAAVAIDSGKIEIDPIAKRLASQKQLFAFLDKNGAIFHSRIRPSISPRNRLTVAETFEVLIEQQQAGEIPRDDLFRSFHLNLLLLSDQPERAKSCALNYLNEVEIRPFTSPQIIAGFWYNLACAQSRLGDVEECRSCLEKSASIKPLDANHLLHDSDLQAVHELNWFKDLLVQFPSSTNQMRSKISFSPGATVTEVEMNDENCTISFSIKGSQVLHEEFDTFSQI